VPFGVLLAAAYTVRPTNAVIVLAFGAWVLVRHRQQAVKVLLGLGLVLVPFVAVNLAAYHAPLPPYFLGSSLAGHSEPAVALVGNLVSPGRGLLIFSPILGLAAVGFVRLIRRGWATALEVAMACGVAGQWVVISFLPNWTGGWQYGPRLFTDALPLLVLLAVPAFDAVFGPARRSPWSAAGMTVVVLLAGFSFFVNWEGAFLRSTDCWNVDPPGRVLSKGVWSWSDPQVLAGVRGLVRDGLKENLQPGGLATRACPPGDERTFG
jgi:hypothetical protein